ncbi:MAG: hypothetical protein R3E12_01095 [Candidatus Eisenbacteria bacterium]
MWAAALATPSPAVQVLLRVIDEEGNPLSARVHVMDSAGTHFPGGPDPFYLSHRDTSWMRGFFYPGATVFMDLPPGSTQITCGRGFEYRPISLTTNVQRDTTMTVVLRRFFDMAAYGFYGGDVHAHSVHLPNDYDVTPTGVLRVATAEDLAMTWVLDGLHEFTGGVHAVSTPDHLLYFSTEYRNQTCGHVSLLGLRKYLGSSCCASPEPIYPLLSDFREEWAPGPDQAMVLCHPANGGGFFDRKGWPDWGLGREAPVLATTGNLDAYDIASFSNVGDIELDDYTDSELRISRAGVGQD